MKQEMTKTAGVKEQIFKYFLYLNIVNVTSYQIHHGVSTLLSVHSRVAQAGAQNCIGSRFGYIVPAETLRPV